MRSLTARVSPLYLAALFLLCISPSVIAPAIAQNAPSGAPMRIRGTVEAFDAPVLTVKSRDGETMKITLAPDYTVSAVVKKSLSDIKPGDYVASTSVKGPDGKLKAVEVHIFPESMRGRGEGQYRWDLLPDSLMTNATVSTIVAAPEGNTMKVTYKGGEAEVVVPPNVPVVGYVAGDSSLFKPGAAVIVFATKGADGTLTGSRVTAEKDGVKPPM